MKFKDFQTIKILLISLLMILNKSDPLFQNQTGKKPLDETKKKLNFTFKEEAKKYDSPSLFKFIRPRKLTLPFFRFKEESIQFTEFSDIGKGPIYRKGWLKFLIMHPNDIKLNTSNFIQNSQAYGDLLLRNNTSTEKDEYGSIDIPDSFHFFFTLTKEGIFVVTARRNDMAKTAEVLYLKEIKKQYNGIYEGGIENQGNFKEGFCFKVTTLAEERWVICADSINEKEQWMKTLAVLKLKECGGIDSNKDSRNMGEAVMPNSPLEDEEKNNKQYHDLGPDGEPIKSDAGKSTEKVNGKWITLQDWSTCTVLCGGGTQTKQRKCISPKNGGNPCFGKEIITKPCNANPCPNTLSSEEQKSAPAILKMIRISERPQRYETCIIKEADIDVIRDDIRGTLPVSPRLGSRIVLNNRTLSVFAMDQYDTLLFSSTLQDIGMQNNYEIRGSCFFVSEEDTKKSITLCPRGADSNKSPEEERDSWIEDIKFFRDKCKEKPLKIRGETGNSGDDLNDDTIKSMTDMQNMALNAVAKEMKYEKMAEKEEVLREQQEQDDIQKKIQEEKEKQACLQDELKKKSKKSDLKKDSHQFNKELDRMKGDIRNMILRNRAEKSKKIEYMRLMSQRRKRLAQSELEQLKMNVAKNMLKASKQGNMTVCDPNSQTQESREIYCNTNFYNEPIENKECKLPESFCFLCCENEFGVLHNNKRDDCYNLCDKSDHQGKGGLWVWVPEKNKINQ